MVIVKKLDVWRGSIIYKLLRDVGMDSTNQKLSFQDDRCR